jgi:hypothetical protein
MKGSLAVPGGPLTSKPAWWKTSECSATPAFFIEENENDFCKLGPGPG